QRRALHGDVEVDDSVVIDVDFPVIIQVAVEPAGGCERDVEIDSPVVVDVDVPGEVGVAGVGEFDQDGRAVDGLAVEDAAGVAETLRGLGDAQRGQAAAGGGGEDAARAGPVAAVSPGSDQACDAVVETAR